MSAINNNLNKQANQNIKMTTQTSAQTSAIQCGLRYYLATHEWMEVLETSDKGYLTKIGLSDIGQQEIGEIVFVELVDPGTRVEYGAPLGILESSKIATEIFSPVSGLVKEINTIVHTVPKKINTHPMSDGWLCTIFADTIVLSELIQESHYRKRMQNITNN